MNYNLSEIQKHAEVLDSEALHMMILNQVRDGKYETCMEALAAYVEENDIELNTPSAVKKLISPSLHGILYKEAVEKSMLTDKKFAMSLDDFF